ncbi:hypothetical protein [Spiroplasma sp. AdecLV25b]|uniref:hypothetical protein n=1 Tax=Spiroplasma sp. AdecLV25b TaxID=3027162 RepID=UPI0027DEE351|nr:hypothetical protein [Spiroplasma sp. AdecLV25b]
MTLISFIQNIVNDMLIVNIILVMFWLVPLVTLATNFTSKKHYFVSYWKIKKSINNIKMIIKVLTIYFSALLYLWIFGSNLLFNSSQYLITVLGCLNLIFISKLNINIFNNFFICKIYQKYQEIIKVYFLFIISLNILGVFFDILIKMHISSFFEYLPAITCFLMILLFYVYVISQMINKNTIFLIKKINLFILNCKILKKVAFVNNKEIKSLKEFYYSLLNLNYCLNDFDNNSIVFLNKNQLSEVKLNHNNILNLKVNLTLVFYSKITELKNKIIKEIKIFINGWKMSLLQ